MKNLFLVILALFISGCTFGPFVNQETARTVGQSNHELTAGVGQPFGYFAKWNYGLTKDLDIGIHLEFLSFGYRAKYAFINNQENGWSLAAAIGAGNSIGGSHQYADLSTSYLSKSWEPYSTVRYNKIKVDAAEFRNKENDQVILKTNNYDYEYGQFFLGTRYWVNKSWFLSIEGSTLFSVSSDLEFKNNSLANLGTGFRF